MGAGIRGLGLCLCSWLLHPLPTCTRKPSHRPGQTVALHTQILWVRPCEGPGGEEKAGSEVTSRLLCSKLRPVCLILPDILWVGAQG